MKPTKLIRITIKSRFTPKNSIVFTDIENEGVILNLKNNSFYSLNETATRIWKLLRGRKTVRQIVEEFMQEYECEKNKALQSIKRQIQEFLASNLIEKSD
jgi:hypothetical protein